MHFSSLWFWGLTQELKSKLLGGKVTGGRTFPAGVLLRVEQAEAWDVIFWLDPRYPRAECLPSRGMHRLSGRWEVIAGARVAEVAQPDSDRRLRLKFEADSGAHVLEYHAFAQPALVLKNSDGQAVVEAGAAAPRSGRPAKRFLLDVLNTDFRGDPATLRGLDDLWMKAAFEGQGPPWPFIQKTGRKLVSGPVTGFLVSRHGKPVGVSLVDFSAVLPELSFEDCESPSHASSKFVSTSRRDEDLKDRRTEILNTATDWKSRLTRTLKELERDLREQKQAPTLQANADWLTAQLGRIKKGQTEITVPEEQGERKVALDPRLKPHEQAERWYQTARRLKRGMETTQARIDSSRAKLELVNRLLETTRGKIGSTDSAVEAAFVELEKLASKVRTRQSVQVQAEPVRFRRFRSPGGLAIWVGRNNHENDELTLHAAHKEDLWFHAQQSAGSHVVLRSHARKQPPSQSDIVAAAATAAYYSKARTSKKVPVIYTLAKYVRKSRRAPAGAVQVEREKSVMVEPGLCPVWDES